MSRFRQTIPIDDYVVDVLMRDIVGHDQQPAAFLVYLVSLRAGGAEEMETGRRERTHACRRDRPFQERRPNRPRKPPSPRIDRHYPGPRHGHFPLSRASTLAHVVIPGQVEVDFRCNFLLNKTICDVATALWAVSRV